MAQPVAPTKSNLLRLQRELSFAEEGYELLDRKREVLIMELMQIIHTISNLERRLTDALAGAYATFREAYVDMGSEAIERANYACLGALDIGVSERSVMGVAVPEVMARHVPRPVKPGTLDTTENFDRSVDSFAEAVDLLLEYAQANLTLTRLANEIQKTQRRVNALEHMFIPERRTTIRYIKDNLEESERDDLFRRKQIKRRAVS